MKAHERTQQRFAAYAIALAACNAIWELSDEEDELVDAADYAYETMRETLRLYAEALAERAGITQKEAERMIDRRPHLSPTLLPLKA